MPTPVLPYRDLYPVTSPSGYSYASAQGVHMTQVEGGFNRYAMDFDRGTRVYNVALACTADHLQVWELFYLHIIKKGALAFEMPLDSGTGLKQHLVNIIPNSVNTTETDGKTFSKITPPEPVYQTPGVQEAQAKMVQQFVSAYQAGVPFDRLEEIIYGTRAPKRKVGKIEGFVNWDIIPDTIPFTRFLPGRDETNTVS